MGLRLVAFFRALDRIPLLQDSGRIIRAGFAKHMRVAADQLLRQALRHAVQIEGSGFRGNFRVQHRLQKQVAQFVAHLLRIAGANRIGHLVGFLDGVRNERFVRLLDVPGAAARRPQAMHHGAQAGEGFESRWRDGKRHEAKEAKASPLRVADRGPAVLSAPAAATCRRRARHKSNRARECAHRRRAPPDADCGC